MQTFVREVLDRLPADRLVVVAPTWPGDREHDAAQPFPVVRRRGYLLHRGLRQLVRRYGCTAAWVPAAAPFALFVPALRRAGITRVVASTHGQELGWLRVGATRAAIGRMAGRVDVLTCLTPTTRELIAPVAPDPGRLALLPGGVDTDVFRPGGGVPDLAERLGLPGAPTVVSVGRLVRRKGHDRLLQAWPQVLAAVPAARLVVVGAGPERDRLRRAAAHPGLRGSATVLGPLALPDLVGCLAASAVFVLPCRDDRRGLQTEGLGLVTLEASAVGLPVVVGPLGWQRRRGAGRRHRPGWSTRAARPHSAGRWPRCCGDPESGAGDGRCGSGLGGRPLDLAVHRRTARGPAARRGLTAPA